MSLRGHADCRPGDHPRQRPEPVRPHVLAGSDQRRRGAVDDCRTVAARLDAILPESWAQFAQDLERARANVLIAVEALDPAR